jgi:hypothetical protein
VRLSPHTAQASQRHSLTKRDPSTHSYADFTIPTGGNYTLPCLGAPAGYNLPSSAFPDQSCFSGFLVTRHLLEVGSFSRRAKLNPYRHYYCVALASSSILYPLHHQAVLRPSYPKGVHRAYPVPLVYPSGLGSNSTPTARHLRLRGA